MSKADERFMAGSPAITREIAIYLAAFFFGICGTSLFAALIDHWPTAIRVLAALAGA